MKIFILAAALILSACGRAQFAGDSDVVPTTSVPVLATGTDYYVEIGERFSDQIQGDITLTNVQMFANATWPGLSSVQFEMRAALTGTTAVGSVTVGSAQPPAWTAAVPVLTTTTIPAGANKYQLLSGNLKDSARAFLTQGKFWILVRVRYAGIDLTNTLSVQDLYVHAEGEKSLNGFSPLINLGF